MNFLHFPILSQNSFLFSIPVKPSSGGKIEILFIYENRAEIGTILQAKSGISFEQRYSYYLDSKIIWAKSVDNCLLLFTANQFKIVSVDSIFKLIYEETILQQHLNHFAVSWNHHYVCASDNSDEFLLIDIEQMDKPTFSIIPLENKKILDITPAKSENQFALLVEENEKKFTILYDPIQKVISKIYEEEPDSYAYIRSSDSKIREFYTLHPNKLTNSKCQDVLLTESPIRCISNKFNDIVYFTLENGLFESFSFKYETRVHYENQPDMNYILSLPYSILLCKTPNDALFLIKTVEPKKSNPIDFLSLDKCDIDDMTQINTMFWFNDKLYFSDTTGDFCRVCNRINKNETTQIKQFESLGKLLVLDDEVIFYTTEDSTSIIETYKSNISKIIEDKPSIAFVNFKKKPIQILSNGLYSEGNRDFEFNSNVILARSNDDQFVVVLDTNEIFLFTKAFKNATSFEIDLEGANITAVELTDTFIIIACFNDNLLTGQLFLLDYDFNSCHDDLLLPSKVTELLLRNDDSELYVVFENGSIMKCLINSEQGITNDISYIYYGQNTKCLINIDEETFAFISSSNVYLCSNNQIFQTAICNVNSIEYIHNEFYIIDHQLNLFTIDPKELQSRFILQNLTNIRNVIQIEQSHRYVFVLDSNSLRILWPKKSLLFENEIARYNIENPLSFALYVKPKHGTFRIVVLTKDQKVFYFKFNPINTSELISLVNQTTVKVPITCMKYWFDYLLLILNNGSLVVSKFIKKNLVFTRSRIQKTMKISHIEVMFNYLFVVYEKKKLEILRMNFDNERFDIIAEDVSYYHSGISSIKPIDEVTVAICYEDGLIVIKEIENDVAHGLLLQNNHNHYNYATHRYSQIPIDPPKMKTMCKMNIGSQITSMLVFKSFMIYSTVNGAIGVFVPITSSGVYERLFMMQTKMREKYYGNIGLTSFNRNSLCAANGIIDYAFIESYLKLEPEINSALKIDKDDADSALMQFYEENSLMFLLKYVNF